MRRAASYAILALGVLITAECSQGDVRGVDLSHATDVDLVHPRIVGDALGRRRRDINSRIYYEEEAKLKIVRLGDWVLELVPDRDFFSGAEAEWVSDVTSGRRYLKPCDYTKGVVRGMETSAVAMTVCGEEMTGLVMLSGAAFFVQPFDQNGTHILYRAKDVPSRSKRSSQNIGQQWEYFNLTGDTIEIDENAEIPEEQTEESRTIPEEMPPFNNSPKWWWEQSDPEELGYFLDTAWEADLTRINESAAMATFKKDLEVTTTRKHQSAFFRKAVEFTKEKPLIYLGGHRKGMLASTPSSWLEIAVAVDQTVIAFHGRDRVEQYVLALMNIVSAIYQDSSLEANMQLVISRLLLYENKKQTVVRPGNAKKSLENVNSWNRRLHVSLAPDESQHDVAIWITRSDIGGPSGYAPVGGVCDPKRSCALNRDEGLTSAFIIAHEMAHILGLSHDGDKKLGNDCGDEALEGSVMAPMVAATFHKFTWSECSRNELKSKISKWTCTKNPPPGTGEIVLNATIDATFSMDEQCRMEFGEGFQLCRAFDIIEPCSHLWCGHVKSPLVCKTKKGPPLEGTECGFDKWCMNGYCEPVDKLRFGVAPVLHNPQHGAWGEWSPWGSCSRSCGRGVRFRSRLCDNPPPAFGGSSCPGEAEEWKVCNVSPCPEPIADMRAQQCRNIVRFLKINDRRANLTWLPYESDNMDLKCQLICISKETRELFVTGENLIDGTPCSYDNANDICIQGKCEPLGCDGYSTRQTLDSCGVCGGNGAECAHVQSTYQKRIKKEVSRVAAIPRLARGIVVEANLTMSFTTIPTAAFILKNRMKKRYSIPIPSTGIHAEIVEGAKFYYKKVKRTHRIWAAGPVLAEIVVLLYAPKSEVNMGLNISINSEYHVRKASHNVSSRYTWVMGGWGPCSVSCGGGKRQKTITCWDNQNQKIVRRKFCSLISKPTLLTEVCNNYSCNFHWITGSWESCSVTCGSYGVQSRELYCVPQSVINAVSTINGTKLNEPWTYMVSPNKCAGMKPISVRPCYRIPCPSYWEYGEWSQCSASCGSGVSMKSTHCPPPEGETFYTCGVHPPVQRRVCKGPFTRRTNPLCKGGKRKRCTGDKSKYCGLPTLSKYCSVNSFKRLCCKSCSISTLYPFSS